MKLVVMIPAHNEEETIGAVVRSIPRAIHGIDDTKVLVINDGSRDRTVEEAHQAGADHVVSFPGRRGLASVFKTGLDTAIGMGADVIVNIDADGQYDADEMPSLVEPILQGKADMVLGSRLAGTIEYMPWQKRMGNHAGSYVVAKLAGLQLSDTQTGYRALTREAAMAMNIVVGYTYTQETVFQAASKLTVMDVPVTFRKRMAGESRLMSSVTHYVTRAGSAILRSFLGYHAVRVLSVVALLPVLLGLVLGARVLTHWALTGMVSPYVPSAMAAGFLIVFGVQIMALGVLAGLVVSNRKLVEDALFRLKKQSVGSLAPSRRVEMDNGNVGPLSSNLD